MSQISLEQIRQEILELAPWHIEIEVVPGLSTAVALESNPTPAQAPGPPICCVSHKQPFQATLKTLYPQGLQQRSFLDCACNCGAFGFWARELGAGRVYGFDAREHWIRQARLLQKYRGEPAMDFDRLDIFDLPKKQLPRFDITLFKGIFYLLSDPIRGLKIAADLTREVLILNTVVANVVDPEPAEGCLFLALESANSLLNGVHGLCWYPSGPNVLMKILEWLGFPHVKLHYYGHATLPAGKTVPLSRFKSRVEIIAARKPGIVDRLKTVVREEGNAPAARPTP